MSERDQAQSVRQAVQELSAKVATWEAELAAWPPAIGESVGRALETAAERAEEQSRREARAWAQERQTWRQEMQSQLQSLTTLTERQARLIARYEAESAPWVLTWSRARWRQVGANVTVTLGVSLLLLALFWWTGPPARDRAELRTYRARWAVLTPTQREEVNQWIRAAAAPRPGG